MLKATLALLAGAVMPFAFAPFTHSYLAFFSLIIFCGCLLHARPGEAFKYGLLFGGGLFGIGTSWIYNSIALAGAGFWVSLLLTFIFVGLLALFQALAAWLASLLLDQGGDREASEWHAIHWITLFPAMWMLSEWIRTRFLNGFPWLLAGYSQTDTLLTGYAPVMGVYGISMLMTLMAAMFVLALLYGRVLRSLLMSLIAGILLVGVLMSTYRWTQPTGQPVSVALIQGNIAQDIKWQPELQKRTLQQYIEMTREHWDARLIVWPETAIPAFYHQVSRAWLDPLAEEARTHMASIMLGIPYVDQGTQSYQNALMSIGSDQGSYFKSHLVPFGEYLPFRPLLGFILELIQFPMADFKPGDPDTQSPIRVAGHLVGSSICYEDVFGGEIRHSLLAGAEILVNVTNDAWFGNSWAPYQHWQIARMRALENGRYMIRATNTGVTGIISDRGNVEAVGGLFEAMVVTGRAVPMGGLTPYARHGDEPVFLIGFGILFVYASRRIYLRWSGTIRRR